MGDDGGWHCLVQMEWRPAGWSVCLPLLIFPCTIKSKNSLLAPAHPGGPRKRAIKRLCVCVSLRNDSTQSSWNLMLSLPQTLDDIFSLTDNSNTRMQARTHAQAHTHTHTHTRTGTHTWSMTSSLAVLHNTCVTAAYSGCFTPLLNGSNNNLFHQNFIQYGSAPRNNSRPCRSARAQHTADLVKCSNSQVPWCCFGDWKSTCNIKTRFNYPKDSVLGLVQTWE